MQNPITITLKRKHAFIIVGVALLASALACQLLNAGGATGVLTAAIESPAAGAEVPVNQAVTVLASASQTEEGAAGVKRIDLLVNNVNADSFESPDPVPVLSANLNFTPTAEGPVTVAVVAFDEEGNSSDQFSISLLVVGETDDEEETTETSETSESEQPAGVPAGQFAAVALSPVNVRVNPSQFCQLIGQFNEGDTFLVMAQANFTPTWYQLVPSDDFPSGGWVWSGAVGVEGTPPSIPAQGCEGCGDGVCSTAETCSTCQADCGACAFCGDGEVNQPTEECDSSNAGCSAGEACNASCTCQTIPAACGNGTLEPGEQCDGAAGTCPVDQACNNATCACEPTGPVCGNSAIEPGEECEADVGGCSDEQVCNSSCSCVEAPVLPVVAPIVAPVIPLVIQPAECGNDVIEFGEVCDGAAGGCGFNEFCSACTSCVEFPEIIPPLFEIPFP